MVVLLVQLEKEEDAFFGEEGQTLIPVGLDYLLRQAARKKAQDKPYKRLMKQQENTGRGFEVTPTTRTTATNLHFPQVAVRRTGLKGRRRGL